MTVTKTKALASKFLGAAGVAVVRANEARFHSDYYLQHDARRLEHLASLRIPVTGMSVLEVGAGIGDHSHYYLDRGCKLTITEARPENLQRLKKRYPEERVEHLDLENPHVLEGAPFDVVHCYGLLYHLGAPETCLAYLSKCCKQLLFLETCVSFGDDEEINLIAENKRNPTQAVSGMGCRPTRSWIFSQLKRGFEHVYIPRTQPNHHEFPVDWTAPEKHSGLARAVFVASRRDLKNETLTTELLRRQERHD
jgi:hypothetical protein